MKKQIVTSLRTKIAFGFTALAVATTLVVSPAHSEEVFSTPGAPLITNVTQVKGGFKVTWQAPENSNPAVTNYVLSGGTDACAVTVAGDRRSAILRALNNDEVSVKLQAVNAYGFSAAAEWNVPVRYTGALIKGLKNVQILQFSDFHGAIETTNSNMGAALMASAFESDRTNVDATFTVAAGDNIGAAPPISSQFDELPTIDALDIMGLDVSTFGNHEHDRNLAHLRSMIAQSDSQWVVSNYDSLTGLRVAPGKRAKKFTIIRRGGVNVGFVGMNTPETPDVTFPGNLVYETANGDREIQIAESVTSTNAAVAAAKRNGADLVVALLHEGWTNNVDGEAVGRLIEVANQLEGVAAIYGAHSHNQYSSVVDGVLTAQVKNAGVQYNRSQICVNTLNNRVFGAANELVARADVSGLTPNASAVAHVAHYKDLVTERLDVVIGEMTNVAQRGGTPAVERSSEAALGSYIADAILNKYGTDLVLINGGGIRDTFPALTYVPGDGTLRRPVDKNSIGTFDVVLGDAYTVLPFGNSISIASISGQDLWAAIEHGVSGYPSNGRFPQIAGFKFIADVSQPVGSRITSITTANGTPIAKDGTVYTIATVDFLVYGGDGYTQFNPNQVQIRDLMVDVFVEALRNDALIGNPTVMATDGRISIIGNN